MTGASPKHSETNPWRERLQALRNMQPVLGILWESGPSVVSWGPILRIVVAILPFAVAQAAQYVIQDIANVSRVSLSGRRTGVLPIGSSPSSSVAVKRCQPARPAEQ